RPRAAEEYRDTIEACLRMARRMTALVEGLLTLARADAGKLDLQDRRVELARVVEEGLSLYRPLAEAKGVTLSAELLPAAVVGDRVWLAQVVANLLDNAIQYNREGGRVMVTLRPEGEAVVLAIADTGCG